MRYSDEYGFFELNPMPGCNQMVVSNHSFIYEQFRGKGLGSKIHKQRLELATSLGYDYIIATVKLDNQKQNYIMTKFGGRRLDFFSNTETGNGVGVWGRELIK